MNKFDEALNRFSRYYRKTSPMVFETENRSLLENKVSRLVKFRKPIELTEKDVADGAYPLNVGLYCALVNSISESKSTSLDEGLIQSYPINFLHKAVKKVAQKHVPNDIINAPAGTYWPGVSFGTKKPILDRVLYSGTKKKSDAPVVMFAIPTDARVDRNKLLDDLIDAGYKFGWDYSYKREEDAIDDPEKTGLTEKERSEFILLCVAFEKRFTNPLANLRKYVFHVCPKKYLSKILQNGLIPKSKSSYFKYQDRVYLFNVNSVKEAYQALDFICRKQYSNQTEEDYCMVIVDADKLQKSSEFKNGKLIFYSDPMFGRDPNASIALFTYQNISPKFLKRDRIVDLSMKDIHLGIIDLEKELED